MSALIIFIILAAAFITVYYVVVPVLNVRYERHEATRRAGYEAMRAMRNIDAEYADLCRAQSRGN
jgi:hypothetical protein